MDTHCDHPGNSITISPDGMFRICCHGKELNSIKNQTIREFFNSKEVTEIKETINANRRHSYCNLCYQQEDMGLCSGRMAGVPVRADSNFPAQIDIKFNNLCNLACKMCDPVSSSKLATEWKQLGWVGEDTPYLDTNSMTIQPNWTNVDYQQNKKYKIFHEIMGNIGYIKKLKFTGGEPFMTKEIFNFLSAVPYNHRTHIDLKFTTNGTQDITEWHDVLKSYKSCRIGVSCDGVDSVYDYIRYPNTWVEWINSSQDIFAKYDPHINCTLTIFNVFNIYNFTKWWIDQDLLDCVHVAYYNEPLVYAPINLPHELKQQAVSIIVDAISICRDGTYKEDLKNIAKHLSQNHINQWDHFVRITRKQDELRKHDITKVIPQFASYF